MNDQVIVNGVRHILQYHYPAAEGPAQAIQAIATATRNPDEVATMEGLTDEESRIAAVYMLACDDTMAWISSILAEAGLMDSVVITILKHIQAKDN